MYKLPLDWVCLDKEHFYKMLVDMSFWSDRMTSALITFIWKTFPSGVSYVGYTSALNSIKMLDQYIYDSIANIPIYFILSPGAKVVVDKDMIAVKQLFHKGISYYNISVGQGQDIFGYVLFRNCSS